MSEFTSSPPCKSALVAIAKLAWHKIYGNRTSPDYDKLDARVLYHTIENMILYGLGPAIPKPIYRLEFNPIDDQLRLEFEREYGKDKATGYGQFLPLYKSDNRYKNPITHTAWCCFYHGRHGYHPFTDIFDIESLRQEYEQVYKEKLDFARINNVSRCVYQSMMTEYGFRAFIHGRNCEFNPNL